MPYVFESRLTAPTLAGGLPHQEDPDDPDAIWIIEVWDSQLSQEASLSLPSVHQAIARGNPLIAGFGERFATEQIGGHGLVLTPTRGGRAR
jgi:hypothetical protein